MPLELAKKPPPQPPSRWKVTAAKIAEKLGHKAALTEIVETSAEKIQAEEEKGGAAGGARVLGLLGVVG